MGRLPIPACPTIRGIQWAVLCAYARTLPLGLERSQTRARAAAVQPTGELGRALLIAHDLGFLDHACLTSAGLRLVLPHADPSPQELPMTAPTPQSPTLASSLVDLVAFYDHQLALPEVQKAPNVEYIRSLQEVVAFLAERESFGQDHVSIILTAQRHALTGITAAELGFPIDPEQDEAVKILLEGTGKMLQKRAAQHGANVQRVVNDLAAGCAPNSEGDVAVLLAVLMYGSRRRPAPQRKSRSIARARA